jgi:competence ComEA-like helix-hairpin-helix protein
MKFTRLQLFLLAAGGIVVMAALWTLATQPSTALVDDRTPQTERVSAGYQYTPIVKQYVVEDMFGNEVHLFTSDGRIKVNINSSSVEELSRLPGVGPATALRILEYRSAHGPFRRVDDLQNVRGIGPRTIERFGDQGYPGEPETIAPELMSELRSEADARQRPAEIVTIESAPCGPGRININTASSEELQTLPRVGPKIAERIINDRTANGPFSDINDLIRVRGIGPVTLERMKDRICAE